MSAGGVEHPLGHNSAQECSRTNVGTETIINATTQTTHTRSQTTHLSTIWCPIVAMIDARIM
jgi:hypothetical protein